MFFWNTFACILLYVHIQIVVYIFYMIINMYILLKMIVHTQPAGSHVDLWESASRHSTCCGWIERGKLGDLRQMSFQGTKESPTRWFKPWPFWSILIPRIGGHQQPLSSVRKKKHHPKKVTIAELPGRFAFVFSFFSYPATGSAFVLFFVVMFCGHVIFAFGTNFWS